MTCGIVLAAGESRRMGRQKVLLDYGGRSVIRHIVGQLQASAIERVYVVTGADSERVAGELRETGVGILHNAGWKEGMLSSVRCGLRGVEGGCDSVMVLLGDQPTVTSGLIDRIVKAYDESKKGILVPVYEGRRGHPIVFSTRYREKVLSGYDDVGLRGLMEEYAADVFEFEVTDANVCRDMDDPADYEYYLRMLRDKGGGE
jgi:molybdenum cofactor cytidylyltransferase